MWKKICFLLILIGLSKTIFSQELLVKGNHIDKDYHFDFIKLSEDEIFSYNYDIFVEEGETYTIKLYAENKNISQKRFIGRWNLRYGAYQFSKDRKKMIFYIETPSFVLVRSRPRSLYLIDGNTGTTKYLTEVYLPMMSTSDMHYLLFYNNDEKTNSKQNISFTLFNLITLKTEKIVCWEIIPMPGGGFDIFRSADSNYDYKIVYSVEKYSYAIAYYSIYKNTIYTIYDVTNRNNEEGQLKNEPLPDEIDYF